MHDGYSKEKNNVLMSYKIVMQLQIQQIKDNEKIIW